MMGYPPEYVATASLLSFGAGMAVGAAVWGGDCDWGNHNVYNNYGGGGGGGGQRRSRRPPRRWRAAAWRCCPQRRARRRTARPLKQPSVGSRLRPVATKIGRASGR